MRLGKFIIVNPKFMIVLGEIDKPELHLVLSIHTCFCSLHQQAKSMVMMMLGSRKIFINIREKVKLEIWSGHVAT